MSTNETVSHIHPQNSASDITISRSSATRRQHASRLRASRRYGTQSRYMKLLGSAAGIAALILLVLAKFSIDGLESENQTLSVKARKQAIQLEESAARIRKLQQDVSVLVDKRIPDLHRLQFDKTIALNQQYVRDVIFTLTGIGSNKEYEYRVVLSNDSLNVAHPFVKVFLFDRLGIQLGMTRTSKYNAISEIDFITLQPGEIRSHSSKVPIDRNETPYYFLIITD